MFVFVDLNKYCKLFELSPQCYKGQALIAIHTFSIFVFIGTFVLIKLKYCNWNELKLYQCWFKKVNLSLCLIN
jgi:hypothetical protein